MSAPTLPLGTHVIYFGTVRDEYAESYSVQGPCACQKCTEPGGTTTTRYRLRGEHIMWDPHSRAYERVGGPDLIHVAADHFVPSPDGPQPWQINQQTLRELGVPTPESTPSPATPSPATWSARARRTPTSGASSSTTAAR